MISKKSLTNISKPSIKVWPKKKAIWWTS